MTQPLMPQRVAALIRLHGVWLWLRRLPVVRRRPHVARTGCAMSHTVDGQRIWITGASSGIGAELARQLVDRGAVVAISARRIERLDEVSGGRMAVVPLDVTDHDAVLAAADDVRAAIGDIDMVVINAGAWTQTKVGAWDADAFRTQVETNLLGANSTLAAVLPRMIERGAGTIVIMASVAGYRGIPGSEAYGATKAALLNLAESLRADLAPAGVTVQWVSPGFVKTELTDQQRLRRCRS